MVDLTRDQNGQVRARLLDLVLGRSGPAYAGWLDARQRTCQSSQFPSPRSARSTPSTGSTTGTVPPCATSWSIGS